MAPLFRDDLPVSVREFQPLVSALDRLPLAQRVAGRDRLNQMLYVNAKTVLPNFILNYLADRMEMAHSIEGRAGCLDRLEKTSKGRPRGEGRGSRPERDLCRRRLVVDARCRALFFGGGYRNGREALRLVLYLSGECS